MPLSKTMLEQIAIALLGVGALWCIQQEDSSPWRRWGPVLGLAGQPFWIYTGLVHRQYGMLFINMLYTVVWAAGVWRHWRPK